jgi:glutaredoxin 3
MTKALPLLYIKSGCPWCIAAEEFLKEKSVPYQAVNVSHDKVAFQKMVSISGQKKAPTLVIDGDVLADFGVDDLEPFLSSHQIWFD